MMRGVKIRIPAPLLDFHEWALIALTGAGYAALAVSYWLWGRG